MKNDDKMGTKKVLPLLVEFSIPAIIGMLVNAIYNIVDRMFIGNAPELGSVGLAGISICYPVTLVLMAISLMIGMGGATRFSIALGQGKKEEAGKYMGNGLTLTIILGFLFMILGNLFLAPMLRLLGASKTVLPYAESYLSIILYGAVFQCVAMAGNNFSRAQGNPKNAMISQLIGAGFNILFDYILICLLHMGMEGAALATIGGQLLSALWQLAFLFGKRTIISLNISLLKLKLSVSKQIIQTGIPAFLMQISNSVLNIILDLVFITQLNMGVQGAAVATVISQGTSVILCIVYMFKKTPLLLPKKEHFEVDKDLYKELLGQGFSMGFMSCIVSAGSVILQYGINNLGYLIIAGHTAARKLYMFFNMPFTAMALAISTFVSQNKGANQKDRIKKALRYAYIYDIVGAAIVTCIILLFGSSLVKLISGSSKEVVLHNGTLYLTIVGPFYAVLGILMQTRYALQGIGQKLLPLISSVIEFFGKIIFVIFLIPRFQYMAVIFCEPVIWCVMTVQLVYSFYHNPYIKNN
jgi:Na+-driven multidrug efflux pump